MALRPTVERDVTRLPTPHEYWRRPPPKDRGDPDSTGIHLAVGMALSKWEDMENNFAWLFGIFCQSGSSAPQRAYGSLASANARRDALWSAAVIYFEDHKIAQEDRDRVKLLLDHFQNASGRRNDVAHGKVIRVNIDGNDRGAFLVPSEYNTRKNRPLHTYDPSDEYSFLQGVYRYTSEDVFDFSNKIDALSAACLRFLFEDV